MRRFTGNVERILDDAWSLQKPVFGVIDQLEVCGWANKCGGNKLYILKCSVCCKDPELFGEGYFELPKADLLKGVAPCGCGKAPKWEKDQWVIRAARASQEHGFKFLGLSGEWKGKYTKVLQHCASHGEWDSGILDTLVSSGHGCPKCRYVTIGTKKQKPDKEMIDSFLASGAFHLDTKFWRSDRKTKQGAAVYWNVSCPTCKESFESFCGDLQAGKIPCGCSVHSQRQAYMNLIIDCGTVLALKFGIARNSNIRVTQQNSKSIYTIINHSIYDFQDVSSCKAAERECKQTLDCGVINKQEMQDGWTETTSLVNIIKIIEIYENHGGVRSVIK